MAFVEADQLQQYGQEYNQRLQAASAGEKQMADDLYRRNLEAAQAQVAQQTNRALGDVAGASAGGGPAMLRGGNYLGTQLQEQGRNEQALQAALAQQAYAAQLGDVYGRRGEYGQSGLGAATDIYGVNEEGRAIAAEASARREIAKRQAVGQGVGLVTGVLGRFMGSV